MSAAPLHLATIAAWLIAGHLGGTETPPRTDAVPPTSAAQPAAAHHRRLARSSSPYLQQHADNPVDWYEWGDEAFAAAKQQGKPIFLSIGYSTCHWCHVMARESFCDPAIAALLNKRFISIKVDREQRPDVDRVYMDYVQASLGRGG
ncbi:MAG: DUF255 domain-containing protein [Planctomycetes bacterium]|nr:DUF255 domain-containing protein [Planctomycetota bacterium]